MSESVRTANGKEDEEVEEDQPADGVALNFDNQLYESSDYGSGISNSEGVGHDSAQGLQGVIRNFTLICGAYTQCKVGLAFALINQLIKFER